jgi:uncharacterized protein YceH (UPF0502 family)
MEAVTLDVVERRVLGVLMEKALALPQYYPMTVNAITTACNQKQNRDPVMDLDEEVVWDALERLRNRNLVVRVAAGAGARTDKFKHNVAEAWSWPASHRAIMAELLLRGPQTVAELRTRASRMSEFATSEEVTTALETLAAHDPPWVRLLPRQPGQSAARWGHLLYPADEAPPAPKMDGPAEEAPARRAPGAAAAMPCAGTATAGAAAASAVDDEITALRDEVRALREELQSLRDALEKLRADLGA